MGREKKVTKDLLSNASAATQLLAAMSNPSRLMILCHLVEREHSVTELEQNIDISQSALSQHLAILRRQKLVSSRRDKRLIYYSISSNRAVAIIETLYEHFCRPDGDSDKMSAKRTK